MSKTGNSPALADAAGKADGNTEMRRQQALLETGALQNAILTSADFTALRDDYDDIICYLLVGADNSVRKQAELKLRRAEPSPTGEGMPGLRV